MKKNILLLTVILSISFSYAGCGKNVTYDVASLNEAEMFYSTAEIDYQKAEDYAKYKYAKAYDDKQYYDEAIALSNELGDFLDATDMAKECEQQKATDLADKLIALGAIGEAQTILEDAGMDESIANLKIKYAKSQLKYGNLEAAYYSYANANGIIEDPYTMYYLPRPNGSVPACFTDDYGTDYTVRGIYQDSESLGISLRFFRNDLLAQYEEATYAEETSFQQWKEMCSRVKLLVNYNTEYHCSTNSGIPYCTYDAEDFEENEWVCWLNFNVGFNNLDEIDSALVIYKNEVIFDLLDFIKSTQYGKISYFNQEKYYLAAMADFEARNYALAKKEFSCLYNYKDSDTYLDLLTTRDCMKAYESLGLTKQCNAARERLNNLIKTTGISIEF